MPQHVRMVAVVVASTFMCSASTRSAFFHPCQHGQKSLLDDPQAVGRHVKARRTQRPRPQNPSPGWVNWPRNTGELRRRCPWCREFFLASAGLHDSTADSAFSWTPGGRRRTGRAASDRIIGPNDRLGDPIRCERRCFLWAPLRARSRVVLRGDMQSCSRTTSRAVARCLANSACDPRWRLKPPEAARVACGGGASGRTGPTRRALKRILRTRGRG